MSAKQRILACRLIEKMEEQDAYSNRLGIKNVSTFHGIQITNGEGENGEKDD